MEKTLSCKKDVIDSKLFSVMCRAKKFQKTEENTPQSLEVPKRI